MFEDRQEASRFRHDRADRVPERRDQDLCPEGKEAPGRPEPAACRRGADPLHRLRHGVRGDRVPAAP